MLLQQTERFPPLFVSPKVKRKERKKINQYSPPPKKKASVDGTWWESHNRWLDQHWSYMLWDHCLTWEVLQWLRYVQVRWCHRLLPSNSDAPSQLPPAQVNTVVKEAGSGYLWTHFCSFHFPRKQEFPIGRKVQRERETESRRRDLGIKRRLRVNISRYRFFICNSEAVSRWAAEIPVC